MTTPITSPAHISRTNGRITLELALRFKDTGHIAVAENKKGSEGTLTNPLLALLVEELGNEDVEIVGRYPGDAHWQQLTFLPA